MPNKKKPESRERERTPVAPPTEAFEQAVAKYDLAVKALGQGDLAGAKQMFTEVIAAADNEPELAQRARTHVAICDRRLAPPAAAPATVDERYTRGVFLANSGAWDEALALLDQALVEQPQSASCLYARASVWALKGSASRAVSDLRQAIAIDPKIRFQAVNDSDFEKIREEPSFIDIIEPTPAGT